MKTQERLLDSMRADMRRLGPALLAEGWTQAEVEEVSALVRQHVAAQDRQALEATAQWMRERVASLPPTTHDRAPTAVRSRNPTRSHFR